MCKLVPREVGGPVDQAAQEDAEGAHGGQGDSHEPELWLQGERGEQVVHAWLNRKAKTVTMVAIRVSVTVCRPAPSARRATRGGA